MSKMFADSIKHSTFDPNSGWRVLQKESEACCPKVLPYLWSFVSSKRGAFIKSDGLRVLLSVEMKKDDHRVWLHVSLSRGDRLPSWDDVKEVKDIFIGKDRTAAQVLPPEDEYINYHPSVLHLWCCLNKKIFPDFRRHGVL